MAPHGEGVAVATSYSRVGSFSKPPRLPLSKDSLQRTISDISFELSKEEMDMSLALALPPISEVEDARCECCGMIEECTPEYIDKVRNKFSGKWICGLCSEAVKEETGKNGGSTEKALGVHMSACAKFKKLRAYPALVQAEAMRDILKKSTARGKSVSPRDKGSGAPKKGAGIARSSSCIPAITRDMNDLKLPVGSNK